MTLIFLFSIYGCLLVLAAIHDVATRTIPNLIPALLILAAIAVRLVLGDVLAGIGIALAVFSGMILLWWRHWVGGGDVKLAAVAAIAIPIDLVVSFILTVAVAGGVLALFYLTLSMFIRRPLPGRRQGLLRRLCKAEAWRINRRGPIPYAVAIAAGGFAVLTPIVPFVFAR